MATVHVIGVPSSAASYSPGQEQAPRALREASLLDALGRAGVDVRDHGDLTLQVWRPDRERPRAQNLGDVVHSIRELTEHVVEPLRAGERLLVLGGNCTIALGVLAGMRQAGLTPAIVYLDRHYDMNTPESTDEGALDWMGVAHALALPDTEPELVAALGEAPLLSPEHLSFLGVDPTGGTKWEHRHLDALQISVTPLALLESEPARAAASARRALPVTPFSVHVDVDVLDFIDAPIAENVNGRNSGPTIEQLADAISELWRDPGCRALSIGELNPVHAASDPASLPRFVAALVGALAR